MRYFLDTEYNGMGGALISLALAPEHGDQELYLCLPPPEAPHAWVAENVMPRLRSVPFGHDEVGSRAEASARIAQFLADDPDPLVVADWPDDIAYLCGLLTTGPGEMVPIGTMRFQLLRLPGFSTAANSAVPHNALHDARALRDFVLRMESDTGLSH
jgi:hypothetical protein